MAKQTSDQISITIEKSMVNWAADHDINKQHRAAIKAWGPSYENGLMLIPAWISNQTHYKVWYELFIHS